MRFAFLTTEYPTVLPDGGGLGTYVSRMAALLVDGGHEAEVFVVQPHRSDVVRHVLDAPSPRALYARRALGRLGFRRQAEAMRFEATAARAAEALEAIHAERPFDVVQSADYCGVGLRVPKRPGRVHVVRCSCAIDLYKACDRQLGPGDRAQIAVEARSILHADVVYAPSRLVADHYRARLGREVHVLRPPAFLEVASSAVLPWLPPRYLVHFAGNLGMRKGTVAVAEALETALRAEPGLTMVTVGRIDPGELRRLLAPLGASAGNVIALYPMPKTLLYPLIRNAAASVLPSVVDNLPNTVIESLLLGVPVIATRQGSVDELVEDGATGVLAPPDRPDLLADAMVAAWRGLLPRHAEASWLDTPAGTPYRPEEARDGFLKLVGGHG